MTPDDVERVLAALRALPAHAIEEAAAHLPGPLGEALRRLGAAPGAADPEEAVQAVAASLRAEPDAARAALEALGGALGADAARLGAALDEAAQRAARATAARDRLVEVASASDDPALADRVRRLLSELGDLPSSLGGIVGALRGVTDGLGDVAATLAGDAAPPDQARLAGVLDAVDGATTSLRAAEQRAAAGLPVIDELVALAPEHPGAVQLRLAAAAIVASVRGAAAARPRWQAAFDAAVAARDLRAAQLAGQRLQTEALARNDLGGVAAVSDAVGALARSAGARRPAVLAALEGAQIAGRAGDHAGAVARAAAAVEVAAEGDDPSLVARARLSLAQVLEGAGDAAGARAQLHRVLDAAKGDRSFPQEVSRAALHLGRLQQGHQPGLARRALELALQLGGQLAEEEIAAQAALLLCAGADDEDAVRWLGAARPALSASTWRDLTEALADRYGRRRAKAWVARVDGA